LFYLLFVFLISSHRYLDVSLFEKIQHYEEKSLSSSKREARLVFLDHVDPICFIPLVTLLLASLKLNSYFDTFRIGICVSVDLLSHAVLSVIQVFYPL
jgi:hypothetical protein